VSAASAWGLIRWLSMGQPMAIMTTTWRRYGEFSERSVFDVDKGQATKWPVVKLEEELQTIASHMIECLNTLRSRQHIFYNYLANT
jgi:hypothetical protein